MNQNQIWFNLNTGIYHKLDVDKLSGFKGISQGFLKDDMLWSDTGVLISKKSWIMIFASREPPQYIVVPFANSKMKDMFTYHNKCKTIKIAVQTANLEK
jgi:hypothetical protein